MYTEQVFFLYENVLALSCNFTNPPEDKKKELYVIVTSILIVNAGVKRCTTRVGEGEAVRGGRGGGVCSFVASLGHLEGTGEGWTTCVPLRRSVRSPH